MRVPKWQSDLLRAVPIQQEPAQIETMEGTTKWFPWGELCLLIVETEPAAESRVNPITV